MQNKWLIFLPNLITAFRLALIPVFIYIYFLPNTTNYIWPILIFVTATFSDILDGYLARKYKLITKLGTMLDPLADKLMLITVLICLCIDGQLPPWVIGLVAIKESFMIVSGIYLFFIKDKTVIPANKIGKAATGFFFLGVVSVLLQAPNAIIYTLIILALVTTFSALFSYIRTYSIIRKKTHN